MRVGLSSSRDASHRWTSWPRPAVRRDGQRTPPAPLARGSQGIGQRLMCAENLGSGKIEPAQGRFDCVMGIQFKAARTASRPIDRASPNLEKLLRRPESRVRARYRSDGGPNTGQRWHWKRAGLRYRMRVQEPQSPVSQRVTPTIDNPRHCKVASGCSCRSAAAPIDPACDEFDTPGLYESCRRSTVGGR